jgi:hypothetical protein
LSNPFIAQTVAFVIVIAVHPDNRQQRMQPALSPPPSSPQQRQRQRRFFTILRTFTSETLLWIGLNWKHKPYKFRTKGLISKLDCFK